MNLNTLDKPLAFAKSFDAIQKRLTIRFFDPFWWIEEMITNTGKNHRENVKLVRQFAADIVAFRKREITTIFEQGKESVDIDGRTDIVSLFIKMYLEGKSEDVSEAEIVDFVLSLIIAGI